MFKCLRAAQNGDSSEVCESYCLSPLTYQSSWALLNEKKNYTVLSRRRPLTSLRMIFIESSKEECWAITMSLIYSGFTAPLESLYLGVNIQRGVYCPQWLCVLDKWFKEWYFAIKNGISYSLIHISMFKTREKPNIKHETTCEK